MRKGRLEILVETNSNITNIMFRARYHINFLKEKINSLVETGFVEIREENSYTMEGKWRLLKGKLETLQRYALEKWRSIAFRG